MSLRSDLIKEFKNVVIPPKRIPVEPVDTPITPLDDLAQQYIMARRSFDDELAEYLFMKFCDLD